MHRWRYMMVLIAGASALAACTTFSTVRSAEVSRGSAFTAQAALASPPGDAAAWFWSYDCESACNHAIPGGDAVYAYGQALGTRHPYTLGAGLNGTFPYVEGYLQLDTSRAHPFGIGVRGGIPVSGWMEHQLYARYDMSVTPGRRFLWNPGVLYHTGHSPNGQNPGTFVGLVNGFGAEFGTGTQVFTPSVAVIWGRTVRENGFTSIGPVSQVFFSAGVSVSFRHRRQ